ncbi:MAG: hypothetical protein ACI8YQ_002750 [Polaribacter sp.]|jgi:hypothetical protein
MNKYTTIILFILLFICGDLSAQTDSPDAGVAYSSEIERAIAETKWRYTYALHLESNTIIHQAEDFYDYYLHFRYDYIYEQYLNGELTRGTWSLNESDLFYSFKHIKKFKITEINKKTLLLEFTQPNSKGTYQYHFVRVESADAPFVKPAYELPDVIVEREDTRQRKNRRFAFGQKRKKKKRDRSKRKKKKEKEVFISIELIGGGYYGGIDPVLRDYIYIKSDGRLVKEYKGLNSGLTVIKKNISRDELEMFAEFIITKKFFEFERMYDCESAFCQERKHAKPTPIPLRLAVAYGNRKKVITISIFGKDKNKVQYVDYPPAVDNIVDAIQRMASRLDDDMGSITKKN